MSILTSQRKQITLAATELTGSATLTGITDVTNCIPFLTRRVTTPPIPSDTHSEMMVDVTFASGPNRVIVTRGQAGADAVVVVDVGIAEADGTDTVVTVGTYAMANGTGSTTANPGLTTKNNAYLIHTYMGDSTSGAMTANNVRGVVTSTTVLTFDRSATSGDIDGHWYTVESTDSSFAVQHVAITIATSNTTGTVAINSIAEAKTFLMGSRYGGSSDDIDDSSADVVLTSDVLITATRENNPGSASLE